ncbi:MAG: hypothetical protein CMP23_12905, partial [Rickettsiales bacterium]|nr:hypothetical protein [Rickettsiales bacterium]
AGDDDDSVGDDDDSAGDDDDSAQATDSSSAMMAMIISKIKMIISKIKKLVQRVAVILSSKATQEEQGGQIKSEEWFNSAPGYFTLLFLILATGGLMLYFTRQAQQGKEMFIRRMPGIDAIEDGIGRATEMGKPVLYVPGIDDLQDIQTIASMLILGQVSKTIAEYQSELIVSCCVPIVREVADEVVRAGFYQAGYPDAFRPEEIRFIAADQFAFCAGTNGIMLREKPATNIYLGRFFAESLILAETGYLNRSIQIAGTAEATQLPFFVAACDYTLIGEELFAVSAYLSRDPRLVSSLKASDYIKVAIVASLLVGTVLTSCGIDFFINLFELAK